MIKWITLLASVMSLIILIIYTINTRKIAIATQRALELEMRPTISCELKSGKNYYGQEIQQNSELKYDTRCIVTNYSKYNAAVFVNLNFKVDGKIKKISDEYAGENGWPITSFQVINGHFNFFNEINNAKKITIDLEVNYTSDNDENYKNPTQHWSFDREKEVWVNNIGLVV